MNGHVVITEGLTKEYLLGLSRVIALHEVSLTIGQGEFLAVVGPSGSGKTTLLNLIGTLDVPTRGRVLVDGVDVSTLKGNQLADFRRARIGFVFQLFNLIPVFTALENVMLPLLPYRRGLPFKLEVRARELLAQMGLEGRADHLPGQLSGGEQQRVAIARALLNSPKLILADEPTGNVDSKTGEEIVSLLRRLNRETGVTLVLVTHNAAIAAQADRVVHLQDGKILPQPPPGN
ncbi:MAG: ABC transporter ATP-binding protein [Chloroflexi bacterium]|nr:ABC transporter ATP-binding protein [Chloroflexota bacterium]